MQHNLTSPRFEVEGKGRKARVFLHCSFCNTRIREIGRDEELPVNRSYLCKACDPDGATVIPNPPGKGDETEQ